MRLAGRSSTQPRTGRDLRRRSLRHHVPLAFASAAVLVLFMSLPRFEANRYPHADIFSGAFPQERQRRETGPMGHGGGQSSNSEEIPSDSFLGLSIRGFTVGTGYVALGFLGLTLLIGPVNLLLRRRNPVSGYLRRDVGTWTAIFSVVHVIYGLQVHDRLSDFLNDFVAPDGSPLTNGFGLGNWTGLAALVIVAGLLALSSDAALRKLKAKNWKRLQRLNYALFVLVIVHAFFYGALVRRDS